MSGCDHSAGRRLRVVDIYQGENNTMKKIMSVLLGLSLVLGAASIAFAQDKPTDDKAKAKDKKGKKKKTSSTR